MTSWNRCFSLFYISFADIRQIQQTYRNTYKINVLINQLAERWINDSLLCPFIPQIAKYLSTSLMQK